MNYSLPTLEWDEVFRERSPEARIDLIRYNIEVFLPKFFQRCENILKERGGKYFAGDKVHFLVTLSKRFHIVVF